MGADTDGGAASPSASSSSSNHLLTDIGNMLKAFIGINFIAVAYAFSNAGIVRGLIGLLVIMLVTEHCCLLLIEIKDSMPRPLSPASSYSIADQTDQLSDDDHIEDPPHSPVDGLERQPLDSDPSPHDNAEFHDPHAGGPNTPSYGDVALYIGGRPAQMVIESALLVTQFGFCVGYLIFLSQTIHDIIGSGGAVAPFVLLPLPILMYLGLLRSIRSLGPFSLLANFALLIGFLAVVTFIGRHFNWTPSKVPLSSFPLFFGQMTAAIEGIGLIIPVQSSMRDPSKFTLVLRIALVTITSILAIVGVLGFATFGAETRSIILLNFGASPVVLAVKIVLIIGILFTYPLQIIPVFEFADRVIGSRSNNASVSAARSQLETHWGGKGEAEVEEDEEANTTQTETPSPPSLYVQGWRTIMARLMVIVLTAVTAVLGGASFGIFMSLVGSAGATVLAYTAPSLFHYMAFRDRLSTAVKVKNLSIVFFGILGGLAGTWASLSEIVKIHQGSTTPG